jgi:hypothetical protein
MSLQESFAPAEHAYRSQVLAATWGHLAPEPRKAYTGYIVFTWASYGGSLVTIDANFEGLPDSPWLYEDMDQYVEDHALIEGTVYRFDGTYTKLKNGKGRFSGKVTKLYRPK